MFTSLEGIDGSGKTTLAKNLAAEGFLVTQEPYLELTRKLLADTRNDEARELAFYVDRLYHLEKVIIPNLKRGIITDRYKYSQIAYAYARYGESELYRRVVELNSTLLEPDLVIFLDLPPGEALRRKPGIAREAERYGTPEAFFQRVRKKYLDMLGKNWIRLDAGKSREEILEEALKRLSQR